MYTTRRTMVICCLFVYAFAMLVYHGISTHPVRKYNCLRMRSRSIFSVALLKRRQILLTRVYEKNRTLITANDCAHDVSRTFSVLKQRNNTNTWTIRNNCYIVTVTLYVIRRRMYRSAELVWEKKKRNRNFNSENTRRDSAPGARNSCVERKHAARSRAEHLLR